MTTAAFLVLTQLVQTNAVAWAQSKGMPTERGAIKDFRSFTIGSRNDIESGIYAPLVDKLSITRKISSALAPVDYSMPVIRNSFEPLAEIRAPKRIFVTVRSEDPSNPDHYSDTIMPLAAAASQTAGPETNLIHSKIDNALQKFATLTGARLVEKIDQADIIVHIDLAERQQTSVASEGGGYNFTRVGMPRDKSIDVVEYILPWSHLAVYYKKQNAARYVQGAEVWIRYPKRTHWQAAMAQAAFDYPQLARNLNLGSTRQEILSKFRAPHSNNLPSLEESFAVRRDRWGLIASPAFHETLLTAASGAILPSLHTGPGSVPLPDCLSCYISCGQDEQAEVLAGRLIRSLAVASGIFRAGAILVAPQGDWTAEFRKNPDEVIAALSLGDYTAMFDQRFDDQIAGIALGFISRMLPKDRQNVKADDLAGEMLNALQAQIGEALSSVAKSLAGDTCLSIVHITDRYPLPKSD